MRKVTLLNPIGYCFGVVTAINKAYEIKRNHPQNKVYVLGELVHNAYVISKLEENGIYSLPIDRENINQTFDRLNPNDIVIFSAHGHPKYYEEILIKKGITYFDTTCRNVKNNLQAIKDSLNQGVIYIGKENHEETIASLSLGDRVVLYDINKGIDYNKVTFTNPLVINQTTLSISEIEHIHQDVKKHLPGCKLSDEICPVTRIRQEQIKNIDKQYDLIVIVGAKNSSNTTKLFEMAKYYHQDKLVIQANSKQDLEEYNLSSYNNIVIGSGTSAPKEIIEEIKTYLERM